MLLLLDSDVGMRQRLSLSFPFPVTSIIGIVRQGRRSLWDRGTRPPNIWTGGDSRPIMNVHANILRVTSVTFHPCNMFLIDVLVLKSI